MSKSIRPVAVYSRVDGIAPQHRWFISDIVKVLTDERPHGERVEVYGKWIDLFSLLGAPEGCDIATLPMKWNHYVDHDEIDAAIEFARTVPPDLPLVVFSGGDWVARLPPELEHAHLLQVSGYRSRQRTQDVALAPFFADIVSLELDDCEIMPSALGETPRVGFCGQSGGSALVELVRTARCYQRRLAWALGLRKWEPAPFEHVGLRVRALDLLERARGIETVFVRRDRYQGGAADEAEKGRQRREFLDTILESDYTLCVRGSGNYSLRFFEALCLGRIPVLLDTDCLLPFSDQIDWDAHCVRVPWASPGDERALPETLREFHTRHSRDELAAMQMANRQLWLDHLSRDGVYESLHRHYSKPPPAVKGSPAMTTGTAKARVVGKRDER